MSDHNTTMNGEQTENLRIGPLGQEWIYFPMTQNFDLSPTSSTGFTFNASRGDAASIRIDPNETAFIIVDMQNFFLDPTSTKHEPGLQAMEHIPSVMALCRTIGIQVIWVNWGLDDEDLKSIPPCVHRSFMRDRNTHCVRRIRSDLGLGVDLGNSKGRCLFKNTWNSDIHPILRTQVQPFDIHCEKNRISGLWSPDQPLWKTLKGNGLKTLVFAGVNTDVCVLGTLTDAYNNGWNCVAIEDCCASTNDIWHNVALDKIASAYGFVTNSANILRGELQ